MMYATILEVMFESQKVKTRIFSQFFYKKLNFRTHINEIYKKTKDSKLMETMKNITAKKRKIEKRLKGSPLA